VYPCKKKKHVVDRLSDFLSWVKTQGYKVDLINSDCGGEYGGPENAVQKSKFQKLCEAEHIEQRFTAANTQGQNGISERYFRVLADNTSAILHEATLDHRFWSLAMKHVCWVKNRMPHRALKDSEGIIESPYERLYQRPAKLAMLRVFGCDSWRFDFDRKKADLTVPKAVHGIFVGISVIIAHSKRILVIEEILLLV